MTLKSPKCTWCGRALLGADASREFCSVACETESVHASGRPLHERVDGLDATLQKWRKRSEGDTYVDRTVRRRTRDCARCDGEGRDPANKDRDCRECNGTGKISLQTPRPMRDATGYLAQGAVAARLAPRTPEVGDESPVPCPHCDGPMTVTSVIPPDSITIECPSCAGSSRRES